MKAGARRLRPQHPAPAGCFVLLCLAWLLSGCASTPQLQALQADWPAGLPAQARVGTVPFIDQDEFECGPAALAMLLQSAGLAASPAQLRPQVFLPGRRGSLQTELLVAARRQGLPAYRLEPSLPALLQELAAGHPVLVFQNLALPIYPVWHYAVVLGFDRERGSLRLHSGHTPDLEMPLSTFERTWERGGYWAMVALPPDQLPATAQAAPMAAAIAALERLQPQPARQAYEQALLRWPEQPALLLGAGNTAYALGDLAGAEAAYRRAVQRLPAAADAWNNLAQVLMERGQRNEARQAITQAIALGGPRLASYQELALKLRQP